MAYMSSMINSHMFKNWLLAEMSKRGWSQSDLARSADLNRAVINKLLNGQSIPRPTTLEAIAHAFRIPVENAFRVAGLLPEIPESESLIEEFVHHIRQIQNPQRKATALALIKVLISEEEQEQNRNNAHMIPVR
jgi:transcriptional regulator with XRE-family HTH domain